MTDSSGYADHSFIAEFYDEDTRERSREDVAFFVDEAVTSGGPVLEIGCGTGRVLIPTARAGIDIVGIDLSTHMLGRCSQRLAGEPASVRARAELLQADMRRFDLGRRFRLVTMPFRPFQHMLTVEDQMACLARVREHLDDEGLFILDLFNPSFELLASAQAGREREEPGFMMADGRKVACHFKLAARDRVNQVNQVELRYVVTHPGGRKESLLHAFPMRYLFRFEAEHLLARAGFEVVQLYSGYDRSAFGSTYPGELLFIARRDRSA